MADKKVKKASQKRVSAKPSESFEAILKTKMRVFGIGGGGSNIVSEISQRLKKADFIAANTDLQALKSAGKNSKTFGFGQHATRGLGCGMDANLGMNAALEDKEKIRNLFQGQDLCILVASLGGGTGSGAAPVFAEISQQAKSLTIGIFTLPFSFEGEKRMQLAQNALAKLKPLVNVYVVIPNDAIFSIVEKDVPLKFALSSVNKKLAESLEGFIETLFFPGLINIDFADVRALLQGRGRLAYLSSATFAGEERAKLALDDVLSNPLYEYDAKSSERILFNIAGSKDMNMQEVCYISKAIGDQNQKAKIIFGISLHPKFHNKLRITVFAIGCEQGRAHIKIQKPLQAEKRQAKTSSNGKKPFDRLRAKKKALRQSKEEIVPHEILPQEKSRRNALDVRKAIDEEIQELQEEEKKWDTPAFLRYKKTA